MDKHQRVLADVFRKKANILWADIEAMLVNFGAEISEGRGSRVRIALKGVRAVFHRPHPAKETERGAVASMRRFFSKLGSNPSRKAHLMTYKGYEAAVTFDEQARFFHGEIINSRDVITFQGTSVDELDQAFKDSVDDYLDFCSSRNESPEKPFSGNFMVRISPELHRKIALAAGRNRMSINAYVARKLGAKSRQNTLRSGHSESPTT